MGRAAVTTVLHPLRPSDVAAERCDARSTTAFVEPPLRQHELPYRGDEPCGRRIPVHVPAEAESPADMSLWDQAVNELMGTFMCGRGQVPCIRKPMSR